MLYLSLCHNVVLWYIIDCNMVSCPLKRYEEFGAILLSRVFLINCSSLSVPLTSAVVIKLHLSCVGAFRVTHNFPRHGLLVKSHLKTIKKKHNGSIM